VRNHSSAPAILKGNRLPVRGVTALRGRGTSIESRHERPGSVPETSANRATQAAAHLGRPASDRYPVNFTDPVAESSRPNSIDQSAGAAGR